MGFVVLGVMLGTRALWAGRTMPRQDNAQIGQCPGRTMPSGCWEKEGCVEVFAGGDRGMAG